MTRFAGRWRSWWATLAMVAAARLHYRSTYCVDAFLSRRPELHDQCRLTCKTCHRPCRCPCHLEAP